MSTRLPVVIKTARQILKDRVIEWKTEREKRQRQREWAESEREVEREG